MRREITIGYALNGYVCRVGCQLVVFQKRNELVCAISDYLQDPEGTEEKFKKEAVNPIPTEDLCRPNPLYTTPASEPVPMPEPCNTVTQRK
jgi:hypothetical protein